MVESRNLGQTLFDHVCNYIPPMREAAAGSGMAADGHAPRQDSHIYPPAASAPSVLGLWPRPRPRPLIVGLRGNRGNGPAKVRRCTQHIGGRLGKKERWGFSSKTIEEAPRGGVHNPLVWCWQSAIKSMAIQGIVTFYPKNRSCFQCV